MKASRIPVKPAQSENTTKTQNLTQVSKVGKPKTGKKKSENKLSKQEIVTRIQEMMETITEDSFKLDPAKLDSKTYLLILNTIFSCFPIDLKQDKVDYMFIKDFLGYIGCPHQVNKTHLQTIGNLQSFADIMAPLVWFYDLLKLYQTGDEFPQDQETNYAETNFNNLLAFYHEFEELGRDDDDGPIKERIAQTFEEQYDAAIKSCKDKIEDYQNQISFSEQKMEQMNQKAKIIHEKKSNIDTLQKELTKLISETEVLESQSSAMDLEMTKLQMELERSQNKYSEIVKQRNSAETKVQELNFDANEVEKIKFKKEAIIKQIQTELEKQSATKKDIMNLRKDLEGAHEAYDRFAPYFVENMPPNHTLPDSNDKENRLSQAKALINALKAELSQEDPHEIEKQLLDEQSDIESQIADLEKLQRSLEKEFSVSKPKKKDESTDVLQEKLKNVLNNQKKFEVERQKNIADAKAKLDEAVDALNSYKADAETAFNLILREVEMTMGTI